MKNATATISISYEHLRQTKFKIVSSPYTFTQKEIYYAEYLAIEQILNTNSLQPKDILQFSYICGMTTPYMKNVMMTIPFDGYELHFVFSMNENFRVNGDKEKIRNMFLCATNIDIKKKVYRKLMLEYHPDKGGNLEITQFINSFKTW